MDDNSVPWRDYVDLRFDERDKAVSAALEAAEKAVDKAEIAAERWRAQANEWRGAMSDRERAFLTRREFYAMVGVLIAVAVALAGFAR